MQNEFNVGDMVLLQLGVDGRKYAPKGLKRWDECRFQVSKVKRMMIGANYYVYYELQACKSPYGIPYSIMDEWLIKMREI